MYNSQNLLYYIIHEKTLISIVFAIYSRFYIFLIKGYKYKKIHKISQLIKEQIFVEKRTFV